MLHFKKLNNFLKFIVARQVLGTQRWLPIMVTYDDGALSLLPGDDRYPSEPELVSSLPVPELNGLVDDAIRESVFLNRMELRGIRCRALSNIDSGCGHMTPISYPSNQFFKSKL